MDSSQIKSNGPDIKLHKCKTVMIFKILCLCFAALCFVSGFVPLVLKGLNAGNIALILYSLLLAAVVLINGRRINSIRINGRHGGSRLVAIIYWIRGGISCFLAVCFITAAIISFFMVKYAYFNKPHISDIDSSGAAEIGSGGADGGTIVVLGCRVNGDKPSRLLKGRLDAAIRYMESHVNTAAVVSGGKGTNEDVPEAYVMKKYMVAKGISEDRIILEDKSVNTDENIRFSVDIIHEMGLSDTLYIVTDAFHSYRAFLFAEKNGYKAYNISSDIYWPLIGEYWVRDILGVLHMKLTPDWDLSTRY